MSLINNVFKELTRKNLTLKLLIYNQATYRFNCNKISDADEKPTIENNQELPPQSKRGGFAKAFERYTTPQAIAETPSEPGNSQTFASLFRYSSFVDLGDPEGKVVVGKVFHIVDNDLYIDFGWKFHCVCTRPTKNPGDYVRGAVVKLRIKELEMSTRFLGSDKDLTILESNCHLLGLISSPMRSQTKIDIN